MSLLKKNSLRNSRSGYTLVEVIIAVQIFLIVLTMLYTVYLYGYRFMVKWDARNDLFKTELLIRKTLFYELSNSPEILEVKQNKITYRDEDYKIKHIHWSRDTIFINQIPLNRPDMKATVDEIRLYFPENNQLKEINFNSPATNNHDLKNLRAIQLTMMLSTGRLKSSFELFQNLASITERDITNE